MSFAPVGYQDGVRTQDWDALAWLQHGLVVGDQVSPIINCQRYGYTYCFVKPNDVQNQVIFWWYTDAALSQVVGGRQFAIDPAVINAAEISYPNLGPYVQCTVASAGGAGASWRNNIKLILNNRVFPVPSVGAGQSGGAFGLAIPANSSVTQPFVVMAPGRWGIYCNGGTQGLTCEIQSFSDNYTYGRVAKYTVAANVDDYREVIMPFAALRAVLTNASATTACNNITLTGIPAVSG